MSYETTPSSPTLTDHFGRMTTMVRASLPIMIGMFADMSINITDTIMVGHLGPQALASLGAANALFMLCLMFMFGIGGMSSALLAQAITQNNPTHTQSTVHGVVATTILVTIITLFTMIDTQWILHRANQPQYIIHDASDYLNIRRWSLIFICFAVVYRGFLSTIGLQYYLTYISIGGLVLNIILNYILIYGHFGFPAMGIKGAAYASNIAVITSFVILYILFRHQKKIPPVTVFKGLLSTPLSAISHTLKVALPVSCALVVEMIFWSGNTMMAGWLGVDALAAHQTIGSIAIMMLSPIIAFSIMLMIQSGHCAGQKDNHGLRHMPLLGILFMGCYSLILFTMALVVVPLTAPHIFTLPETVLNTMISGMITLAFTQVGYGLYICFTSILKGFNDTHAILGISTLTFVIIGLSLGYTFGHIMSYGIMGQWVGMIVTAAITACAFYIRFRWMYNRPHTIFNKVKYAQ